MQEKSRSKCTLLQDILQRNLPLTPKSCLVIPSLTNKAFYADWNGTPVAVEEFVPGEFTKYINNDGLCTHLSDYIIDILCVYYSAHSPLRLSGARYLGLFNMFRYHEI